MKRKILTWMLCLTLAVGSTVSVSAAALAETEAMEGVLTEESYAVPEETEAAVDTTAEVITEAEAETEASVVPDAVPVEGTVLVEKQNLQIEIPGEESLEGLSLGANGYDPSDPIVLSNKTTVTKTWNTSDYNLDCINLLTMKSNGTMLFRFSKPVNSTGKEFDLIFGTYNASGILTEAVDSADCIKGADGFYYFLCDLSAGKSYINIIPQFTVLTGTATISYYYSECTETVAFVNRLYTNVLGRQADYKGLADWTARLETGYQTGAQVAAGFVFSSEYTNKKTSNSDYVEMLYKTLMNRASDAAGKKDWLNRLSYGVTRAGVFAGFVNAAEFNKICTSYGIKQGSFTSGEVVDKNHDVTAFVARMYTVCLGRSYDKVGLYDWTNRLITKQVTGGQAAKGFFFSTEFKAKNYSHGTFVTLAYRTLLNREPDAGGLKYWVDRLNSGHGREAVLDGFIYSVEFEKLCNQYNITR